jgi:putative chitinase
VTPEQLRSVMPFSAGRADAFVQPLTAAMAEFGITTAKRQAAFLAQIAEESGELRLLVEIASGEAYEGRADLGNTQIGDGVRYKGRGLLQVTGRANYDKCGLALGLTLIFTPTLLETPVPACRSAGWFWNRHGLNELADTDKFGEITHRINGGYTHLDERLAYWLRARKAFNV